MSKHETPLTRWFWQKTGGALIEEFLAVPLGPNQGKRLIDGIIVLDQPFARVRPGELDLEGKDIIAVQTKANP